MDKDIAISKEILISIVVPVFNKEKELGRCIDSIKFQNYKTIEIILVDDGSTDGSSKICDFLQESDERIKVIHQCNSGVSVARNMGITESCGDWIMFVDPDDVVLPNIITELTKNIKDDVDVIAGCLSTGCLRSGTYEQLEITEKNVQDNKISFFDEDTVFSNNTGSAEDQRQKDKRDLYLELINENYGSNKCRMIGIGTPCVKLYRKSFLYEYNIRFNKELIRMQDNIFNMDVFYHAKKVVYVDKPLYVYDLSHKKSFQRKYDENAKIYYDKVLRYRYKFLTEKDMLKGEYYDEFCAGVVEVTSAILKHEFLSPSNPKKVSEIIKDMKCFFGDELYQRAFHNRHMGRVRPVMKLRAILLRYEAYRCLIWLERIIYIIKRVRV